MSSCCNGPKQRKIKEWGCEGEKKSGGTFKIVAIIAILVLVFFIVSR